MATNPLRLQQAYGIGNSLQQLSPFTIIANRAPTTSDKARLGTLWDFKTSNLAYMLTSVTAGASNWTLLSNNGGAGVFSSLTVNGPSTFAGNITQTAGVTSLLQTTINGSLTQNGGATLLNTDATPQTVNIGTGAAAKTLSIGSATAGSTLVLNAAAAVSIVADLEISTAGKKLIINGGAVTDFIGTATLAAGTVTIANTNITANDRILLSRITAGVGAVGFLTYVINAATNFVVSSVDSVGAAANTDVGSFAYVIIRQS